MRWSSLSLLTAPLRHAFQFVSPHFYLLARCLQSSLRRALPSFTSTHASLLALLHLTCCFSPLFPLCHSSPFRLPDIMSNHYLHLSCCSSPSIYPLSLPSTPPRLSPPDRATYYLYHSLHSSFLSHLLTHSHSKFRHTFTLLTNPLSEPTVGAVSSVIGM